NYTIKGVLFGCLSRKNSDFSFNKGIPHSAGCALGKTGILFSKSEISVFRYYHKLRKNRRQNLPPVAF
ncbi:hypothetical protein, partial [Fusicatenibacter sp.]